MKALCSAVGIYEHPNFEYVDKSVARAFVDDLTPNERDEIAGKKERDITLNDFSNVTYLSF